MKKKKKSNWNDFWNRLNNTRGRLAIIFGSIAIGITTGATCTNFLAEIKANEVQQRHNLELDKQAKEFGRIEIELNRLIDNMYHENNVLKFKLEQCNEKNK